MLTPLSVVAAIALTAGPAADPLPVVGRMLKNLGGVRAPYQVQSIAFSFAVESDGEVRGSRRHRWEPKTSRHQLQYQRDGHSFDVDWSLESRTGHVTRDGEVLAGSDLDDALKTAWGAWVNDSYWLLMPYKTVDPGVWLEREAAIEIDGRWFDPIRLTFQEVGLTPGDTYWLYISREHGLPERWSFVLEGREPPAVEWVWSDWGFYGPLLLSRKKQRLGSNQTILTHDIQVEE